MKTISLFSLIVTKKGILEKRLISAPVAPIVTSNAGRAQQIRVLVLAKRTIICAKSDLLSLFIKIFQLMKQYIQNL